MLPLWAIWLMLIAGLVTAVLLPVLAWQLQLVGLAIVLAGFGAMTLVVLQARRHLVELHRLRSAYDQLDQQAKLMIQTDVELHHAQEELDRKLDSLMSLHTFGQQLSVGLTAEEVLAKLDAATVTKFGYSKALLGVYNTDGTFTWHLAHGVAQTTAAKLREHLSRTGLLGTLLTQPAPKLLQASLVQDPVHQQVLDLLESPLAVLAGIIPHAEPKACLIVARAGSITNAKGDEELLAILTNQLTIAIDNSALYEEAWKAKQVLERKVQQRTHELAEANAALVRLNKSKSNFVSAVSHELRTPLAAIKGYASLLGSGQFGPLEKAQSDRLAKIEKHADGLTQLINNLLDIARIESGRITMEQKQIPVQEFFSAVQDLVRPQIEAKQIQYTADLDGVTELTGDEQHLQRVFMNLLSNAVKYTPDGGRITLGLRADGGTIVATVRDSGCGIPPEDLPKLFQEFYRSSDPINQQIRGTGLGLALVKRIVEAHQGEITVASERGQGSTFTVTLPAGLDGPREARPRSEG
ncbi:MAG TPA: ATP-binding protein [bacterium]